MRTERDVVEAVPTERGPLLRVIGDQRVAFLVVGGLNTVLGTAWFIGFQLFFEELRIGRFDYVLSLVCAHAASVLCSFVMQRTLVFRVRGHFGRDFLRFTTVSLSALGLNLALMAVLVELAGLPKIPAQLVVTAMIALGTYFLHRDYSFSRRPPASPVVVHTGAPDQRTAGSQDR